MKTISELRDQVAQIGTGVDTLIANQGTPGEPVDTSGLESDLDALQAKVNAANDNPVPVSAGTVPTTPAVSPF